MAATIGSFDPSDNEGINEGIKQPPARPILPLFGKWGKENPAEAKVLEEEFAKLRKETEKVEATAKAVHDAIAICDARIRFAEDFSQFYQNADKKEVMDFFEEWFPDNTSKISIMVHLDLLAQLLAKVKDNIEIYRAIKQLLQKGIEPENELFIDDAYDSVVHVRNERERMPTSVKNFIQSKDVLAEDIHLKNISKLLKPHLSSYHSDFNRMVGVNYNFKVLPKYHDKFTNAMNLFDIKYADNYDNLDSDQRTRLDNKLAFLRAEAKKLALLTKKIIYDGVESNSVENFITTRKIFANITNLNQELDILNKELDQEIELSKAIKQVTLAEQAVAVSTTPTVAPPPTTTSMPSPQPQTAEDLQRKKEIEEREAERQEKNRRETLEYKKKQEEALKKYQEEVEKARAEKNARKLELMRALRANADSEDKKVSEDFFQRKLKERNLLTFLHRELNPSQRLVLEKLFATPSKHISNAISLAEFTNLVLGLHGEIVYTSSHYRICLPNTYLAESQGKTLSFLEGVLPPEENLSELVKTTGGSFKSHGRAHTGKELPRFAQALCKSALVVAGITLERIEAARISDLKERGETEGAESRKAKFTAR